MSQNHKHAKPYRKPVGKVAKEHQVAIPRCKESGLEGLTRSFSTADASFKQSHALVNSRCDPHKSWHDPRESECV